MPTASTVHQSHVARPTPAPRGTRSHTPTSRVVVVPFRMAMVGGGADPSNPKWIQVCRTGEFNGYGGGKGPKFAITDDTLDRMIANLRAHPSYTAGAESLTAEAVAEQVAAGTLGVVPFDFEHGHGPAEAWGLDLQRRPDPSGQGSSLWMYTYFLEPAATWMRESRVRWTSIEWEENATNPISGEKIGPYVIRVALTNDPFLQGMKPIQQARGGCKTCDQTPVTLTAAEARALEGAPIRFGEYKWDECIADQRAAGHSQESAEKICGAIEAKTAAAQRERIVLGWDRYEMPKTPTDLLCALRDVFGLPEIATTEEVLGAIARLRSWTPGEIAAPPGVDAAQLLGEIRYKLNLPTLSDSATIFAELDKLLGAIAAETEETTMPPTPATAQPDNAALAQARERDALLLSIGKAARLPDIATRTAAPTEAEIVLHLERQAVQMNAAGDALALVAALGKALGTTDPKELSAKITELAALDARMKEIVPELAAADEEMESQAMGAAEQDVVGAMAAHRLDPRTKDALMLERKGGSADFFKGEKLSRKDLREKRAKVAEAFRAKWGLNTDQPANRFGALGNGTLFAGPSPQFAPPGSFQQAPLQAGGTGPVAMHRPGPGGISWANVLQHAGRNDFERCVNFVRAQQGGADLTYDQANARAYELRNQLIQTEGPCPAR